MTPEQKGILISGIIRTLNEHIIKENKKLCEKNLFAQQKPLHGADMLFKLAYMDDEAIRKIASACGL